MDHDSLEDDQILAPVPTRSVGDVLMAVLAGSVLLPALEAMASRGGESLYDRLSALFTARQAGEAERRLRTDGEIDIVDAPRRLVFRLPADITPEESAVILGLRMPAGGDEWLLVRKDHARQVWVVDRIDSPPLDAIET